jgi:hypothetical protein
MAGPTHNARHARAAFPRGAFALTERSGAARVIAVREPWPVVGAGVLRAGNRFGFALG